MEWLTHFLADPIAAAFLIIVIGTLLGRASVAGVSLGSSGVLFAALAFGAFGWVHPGPELRTLANFGVVFFVYAIGLQAGPRFIRMLRTKGPAPLVIAAATVIGGALFAAALGTALGLKPPVIVGVFAGALTSTPALAAATEAAGTNSAAALIPVAYGVAYPFGVIVVVLFAQLLPRYLAGRPQPRDRQADMPAADPVLTRCFQVENPAVVGQRLSNLHLHEMAKVNVSRVWRGDQVIPASGETRLQRGDVILAVGAGKQLERLAVLIGPPCPAEVELLRESNVVGRDINITEAKFAGRTLRDLQFRSEYGVIITRVRREGFEFVPHGDFVLEVGDLVRAVGGEAEVAAFARAAGIHERRLHETGIPAFSFGLIIGLLIGFTPIPLPGGTEVRLGLAGGPLFVGLLLGHFGRIGRLRVHVPAAGRYLMRELGLVLFLVNAGIAAGDRLIPVLQREGFSVLVLSVATVLVAAAIGFCMAYMLFRQTTPSSVGMTCGAMTSTPGLGAASAQFESDVPALSYAAVYPLALVLMTVTAQIMLSVM